MADSAISGQIESGSVFVGIELGSTRIKSVLVTADFQVVATGSYTWENQQLDGIWTYELPTVWEGIQQSYQAMAVQVQQKYHCSLTRLRALGISAMMHGYLAFDQQDQLLVPFRTWRNNLTAGAADQLTALFETNIPQRWSIAHLYQAMLNHEPHVSQLNYLTTLAGYVHWQLSGEKVLGIGDASGMFPIDSATGTYDAEKVSKFEQLALTQSYAWKLKQLLPKVLPAGAVAGNLTAKGAALLDPSGQLEAGCVMAPPEGDASTGMVATNSIRPNTGNISVGTSAFSMTVLSRPLSRVYRDIDLVMTPTGQPVAMVHVNNCSSDLNAWVQLFQTFSNRLGVHLTSDQLYQILLQETTRADADAGNLVNYNYESGENITRVQTGQPLFLRGPENQFTLANFIQAQLYAAVAPLKMGLAILTEQEQLRPTQLVAQGGLFRTPKIAQQMLANALQLPITTMPTASEGGPWGMAVLAIYASHTQLPMTLTDFLDQRVFAQVKKLTLLPEVKGTTGYQQFIKNYQRYLPLEASLARIQK